MSPRRPFIPEPLPPGLSYDLELDQAVAESNRHLGELAGLARHLPNPHLLIRPFIRREAVLSSRIEGTEAGIADLYAYEAGQLLLPNITREVPAADAREVRNYVLAMEHGLGRLGELPVSLRLLRELHRILMDGARGQTRAPGDFRRIQNWIGPPGCSMEEATFVPPPAHTLEGLLGRLESYIHTKDPSHPLLVRLALIHYQFEAIHPFLDGNGRIGRLLISLLLVCWDLLPHPLLYLSAYFESRRREYYERLLGVSTHGEWRPWVLFFLRGVARQAQQASLLVKELQDLQQQWRTLLARPGASALETSLMETLFDQPVLSIPDAAARLEVTYPTAKKHVEHLFEIGILEAVQGTSNPKIFVAREILHMLQVGEETDKST